MTYNTVKDLYEKLGDLMDIQPGLAGAMVQMEQDCGCCSNLWNGKTTRNPDDPSYLTLDTDL